jgi:hypothetical protein
VLIWQKQTINRRAGAISIMVGRTALKRKKSEAVYQDVGPTPQRLRRAQGDYSVGDDKQGGKTWTMQDSPLDRLKKQAKIPSLRYEALNKFRVHWYHAGLSGSVSSMDLNRVFASDLSSLSGMAKTEAQAFHRQQYRNAKQHLTKLRSPDNAMTHEQFSHKCGIVVDNVLCSEHPLEFAGYAVGASTSRYRAREAAKDYLAAAADALIDLWGLAGKRR